MCQDSIKGYIKIWRLGYVPLQLLTINKLLLNIL